MAFINIDLEDGKSPVQFTLNAADTRRFQVFMEKYNILQTAVNDAFVRLNNTVSGNVIPMPDRLRMQALMEITESLRDELQPLVDE